jgi:hypothetical protein
MEIFCRNKIILAIFTFPLTKINYFYFILCQISILYVISLNPGKRKKRPDAG